jgi:hypothetical protein
MSDNPQNNASEPLEHYQQPLTFEKVWAMFKETDRQFRETDLKFSQLYTMFTSNWGKLMESLIEPSAHKLFKNRGIDVSQSFSNIKVEKKNLEAEFDIVLANGDEVVVMEVKTTFTTTFVDEFLEKLNRFREYFPIFADKKIYGAVAGIKYDQGSDKYALRKGFFVVKNSGEGLLKLANSKTFQPAQF